MAYTDDWESLMNGVFGPGGKLRSRPKSDPETPPKQSGGFAELNAVLLDQQRRLDEQLRRQSEQMRRQDTAAADALASSRQMLQDMEEDGLLSPWQTGPAPAPAGSFEGLADEVKKTVLGQDPFVEGVVRAMRRPFVMGVDGPAARNVILLWGSVGTGRHFALQETARCMAGRGVVRAMRRPFVMGVDGPAARNVILLWGSVGTGRHFALQETARCMAGRGLLRSDRIETLDLALYPNAGDEKLFLQDLYAALHAPGDILALEHYENCHPAFLRVLGDLAMRGSAPLSSRYLVNKQGILVDAGTALAPGAVGRIDPQGKYLVFFSHKGRQAFADKLGAPAAAALGDVCRTSPFTPTDLAALAACGQAGRPGCRRPGGCVPDLALYPHRPGGSGRGAAECPGTPGQRPAGADPCRRCRCTGLCGRPMLGP